MAKRPHPPNGKAGFTLIELLVVLAILAALSIAFVYSIGSKSPKAVKTGLLELKSAMQEARQAAISGGRQVNLVIEDTAEQARIRAYFTQPDGTIKCSTGTIAGPVTGTFQWKPDDTAAAGYIPPVVDRTFEKSWRRYAQFTSDMNDFGTETAPMKDLDALKNFNFTGWSNTLSLGASKFGFSSTGSPQSLTDSGKTRAEIPGGIWMGICGKHYNQKGLPYGGVFVTDRGRIIAFYKPDAKLDTADFKWQRME